MLNYLPLEYADLHIFTLIAMSIKGVNVKSSFCFFIK